MSPQNGLANMNNGGSPVSPSSTPSTWTGSSGRGGLDLRSDTMTIPTAQMLKAIETCTHFNDVYREDTTVSSLEEHVARLTGKEAGLFVVSGTMANQLSLRAHLTQPPHGVLCDVLSHVVVYEAGGVSTFSGAMTQPVRPSNGVHLTLADVERHAIVGGGFHSCPTRVISLEVPLNGMIMPLSEARAISEWARARDIRLHCDGARLWEAVATGHGTLPEYAACFDTVSLCLSKGIGAPMGSVIVGSEQTLTRARWLRQMIGGGWKHAGMVAAAARAGLDDVFGSDPAGADAHKLRFAHDLAKEVAALWTKAGGRFVHPVHTNMVFLDLAHAGVDGEVVTALAKETQLALAGGRLVFSHQACAKREYILEKLEMVFSEAMAKGKASRAKASVGTQNGHSEDQVPRSIY